MLLDSEISVNCSEVFSGDQLQWSALRWSIAVKCSQVINCSEVFSGDQLSEAHKKHVRHDFYHHYQLL